MELTSSKWADGEIGELLTTCQVPNPCPSPSLSPLEAKALMVRESYRHWSWTISTACPHGHAPLGKPCWPGADHGDRGSVCVDRCYASARRAAGVDR
jgi:hypothetical protein